MMRGSNPVYPIYDARGNVNGYLENSAGSIYRAYHFDAFGNPVGFVLDSGVTIRDFIGFGSKLTDVESGLVDFGLRLYQPKHGRFITRDPIGEAGGENLYAHTWNDPVNRWDYLGLTDYIDEKRKQWADSAASAQEMTHWLSFSENGEAFSDHSIWIDGASISYGNMMSRLTPADLQIAAEFHEKWVQQNKRIHERTKYYRGIPIPRSFSVEMGDPVVYGWGDEDAESHMAKAQSKQEFPKGGPVAGRRRQFNRFLCRLESSWCSLRWNSW